MKKKLKLRNHETLFGQSENYPMGESGKASGKGKRGKRAAKFFFFSSLCFYPSTFFDCMNDTDVGSGKPK